jgi:hypothetical protein
MSTVTGDGLHRIRLCAKVGAGGVGLASARDIRIDQTGPFNHVTWSPHGLVPADGGGRDHSKREIDELSLVNPSRWRGASRQLGRWAVQLPLWR